VNVRLARAVVALYPASWRRRYGDELVALLEELPATPANVTDASLRAIPLRLRSMALVAGAAILAGLPMAAGVKHSQRSSVARAESLLPGDTACRRYSSVAAGGSLRERRCLD
jgi:hypothetical protein